MTSKTIFLALASFAMAATPLAAAHAAQDGEQRVVGVTFRDLDLSTEAGRAELDRRIDRAARSACGMEETALGTRLPSRDQRACFTDAKSQLDRQFASVIARGRAQG